MDSQTYWEPYYYKLTGFHQCNKTDAERISSNVNEYDEDSKSLLAIMNFMGKNGNLQCPDNPEILEVKLDTRSEMTHLTVTECISD